MSKSCVLTFQGYNVDYINYKSNYEFNIPEDGKIRVNPKISRSINKEDNNDFNINLLVEIECEECPFSLSVAITGFFSIDNIELYNTMSENNATAILYPYIRALISNVTANANVPSYNLPAMNIAKFFEKDIDDEDGKNE